MLNIFDNGFCTNFLILVLLPVLFLHFWFWIGWVIFKLFLLFTQLANQLESPLKLNNLISFWFSIQNHRFGSKWMGLCGKDEGVWGRSFCGVGILDCRLIQILHYRIVHKKIFQNNHILYIRYFWSEDKRLSLYICIK